MIEMRDVSVRRGETAILDRVSFSIGDEVVALAGPSGSGKTTLLRALLGLETPSEGEVRIGGRLMSTPGRSLVPPEDRNVAMVFQDLALWPHLSAQLLVQRFGLGRHRRVVRVQGGPARR